MKIALALVSFLFSLSSYASSLDDMKLISADPVIQAALNVAKGEGLELVSIISDRQAIGIGWACACSTYELRLRKIDTASVKDMPLGPLGNVANDKVLAVMVSTSGGKGIEKLGIDGSINDPVYDAIFESKKGLNAAKLKEFLAR